MTLDRVPWFGRHVENLGDVIIYPVLVVARTTCSCNKIYRFSVLFLLVTRHDHPIWKNVGWKLRDYILYSVSTITMGKKQFQHFYRELQVCF